MFDSFVITAAALKIAYAALGIVLLVFVSRWLDARASKALSRTDPKGFGAALAAIRKSPFSAAIYYGLRFAALGLVIAGLMGCTRADASTVFPARYDHAIARAVSTYWPDYPYPVCWKAQLYQESRLDPAAVSPVGAAGLAQIMPGTWEDLRTQLRLGPAASPHDDIAIAAGAYYMAQLRRAWTAPRPPDRRQALAQASYNAGLGNILSAQRSCGGARDWPDIAPCLPAVTGPRHAAETAGYVRAIAKWRTMMEAGL
ncbi:MAG: transglycosylase SLT domain-containing protein [Rhodospirillaceae bacterium]